MEAKRELDYFLWRKCSPCPHRKSKQPTDAPMPVAIVYRENVYVNFTHSRYLVKRLQNINVKKWLILPNLPLSRNSRRLEPVESYKYLLNSCTTSLVVQCDALVSYNVGVFYYNSVI